MSDSTLEIDAQSSMEPMHKIAKMKKLTTSFLLTTFKMLEVDLIRTTKTML